MLSVEFTGAPVLGPDGFDRRSLAISDGLIVDQPLKRRVDLTGFSLLPGMIDLHGDGFERHVAPRRGAMTDLRLGLRAAEVEMAACGITTGYIAQFLSWEGGLRGPDFADKVFTAMVGLETLTDLRPQVRFETHMFDHYEGLVDDLDRWGADYVVFNDHLQHDRLAAGRRPKQLEGQALKAGRSPQKHLEMLMGLEACRADVPAALDRLCERLRERGISMGSHDDRSAEQRSIWTGRGVTIAEFPETEEAAQAAQQVVFGAPNVVRGASHKGNMSAGAAILAGIGTALASDYHYPSLLRAALLLGREMGIARAWRLVSQGPAEMMGLSDRGTLMPGKRADIVILDAQDHVAGTICNGRVSFLRGDCVQRFV